MGLLLALDDFGSAHSSLGYLTRLPFQRLKVDKVFVSNAAASVKDKLLLEGIVALARTLTMEVVGEGAETLVELDVLRICGCDLAQGYIISRPMPLATR